MEKIDEDTVIGPAATSSNSFKGKTAKAERQLG